MITTCIVGSSVSIFTRLVILITIPLVLCTTSYNLFQSCCSLVNCQVQSINISEATSCLVINLEFNNLRLVVCHFIYIPSVRTTFCNILYIVISRRNWGDWEDKLVLNIVFARVLNSEGHVVLSSCASYNLRHC